MAAPCTKISSFVSMTNHAKTYVDDCSLARMVPVSSLLVAFYAAPGEDGPWLCHSSTALSYKVKRWSNGGASSSFVVVCHSWAASPFMAPQLGSRAETSHHRFDHLRFDHLRFDHLPKKRPWLRHPPSPCPRPFRTRHRATDMIRCGTPRPVPPPSPCRFGLGRAK